MHDDADMQSKSHVQPRTAHPSVQLEPQLSAQLSPAHVVQSSLEASVGGEPSIDVLPSIDALPSIVTLPSRLLASPLFTASAEASNADLRQKSSMHSKPGGHGSISRHRNVVSDKSPEIPHDTSPKRATSAKARTATPTLGDHRTARVIAVRMKCQRPSVRRAPRP